MESGDGREDESTDDDLPHVVGADAARRRSTRALCLMTEPVVGESKDRLDAWFDGSAICVVAVGSHGDPVDLADHEVEAFIAKLQDCLRKSNGE